MKKTCLFLSIVGMAFITSCTKQDNCPDGPDLYGQDQTTFTASITSVIQSRVQNNTWEASDAIGIYALKAGQTLSESAVYEQKANVKHTTTGDGVFKPASEGIVFPESGALDFIAYYPFQEKITDASYAVDVTNQSNPSAIDVLYSANAKNIVKEKYNSVALVFDHVLTSFVMHISAGEGITTLNGLSAKIDGLKVTGTMNLATGVVSPSGSSATITPSVKANGTQATISAIILPGQDLSAATITLVLGRNEYEWHPTTQNLESGKRYSYPLQLSMGGIKVLNPNATINDWDEGYSGTTDIVLSPIENEKPQFSVDHSQINLDAMGTSGVLKLIAAEGMSWTASSDQNWLSLMPQSGTGSANITLTAEKNTTETERTASVTLTTSGLDPITVSVTQAAAEPVVPPTPANDNLLVPGADFENWNLFEESVTVYNGKKNIQEYVTQSNEGRNGSKALHILTTPQGNDYAVTIGVPENASWTGKTKINLWIKGAANGKSISFNVYKSDNSYVKYNLGNFSEDSVLRPEDRNNYNGSVQTNGEWKMVTLDISGLDLANKSGKSLLAIKIGKGVAWDVYIDDITIE